MLIIVFNTDPGVFEIAVEQRRYIRRALVLPATYDF
ncbi:hypothetical protein GFK82_00597 [Candidatus Steffania adelgidicola]|nr:hypothetical protein GFK82_00597 [Candidatus Steffania adelgidicola]